MAPITLVGLTALSVDTKMNHFSPYSSAAWGTTRVDRDVVLYHFSRTAFHQRHVLVRDRVKEDLGTMLGEHLVEVPGAPSRRT